MIGTSKLHRSFTENPENSENGEEDGESAGLTANCILDVPHLVNIPTFNCNFTINKRRCDGVSLV